MGFLPPLRHISVDVGPTQHAYYIHMLWTRKHSCVHHQLQGMLILKKSQGQISQSSDTNIHVDSTRKQ
jgi:hypothetical protein